MKIKEILTYDFTTSDQFKALAPYLNLLFALFFFWIGIHGIADKHLRFKRYDYFGLDAQVFGLGLCGLGGAWVLYTTLGSLFERYRWCRVVAAVLGLTFIVCAVFALARNI